MALSTLQWHQKSHSKAFPVIVCSITMAPADDKMGRRVGLIKRSFYIHIQQKIVVFPFMTASDIFSVILVPFHSFRFCNNQNEINFWQEIVDFFEKYLLTLKLFKKCTVFCRQF
jgi:hypothetical protein